MLHVLHLSLTLTVFVITIVYISSVNSILNPSETFCLSGWRYIDISDKCIKIWSVAGTRDENVRLCEMMNASMITIESAEENKKINHEMENPIRFWIAGTTEGVITHDGRKHQVIVNLMKSTNYANWDANSPSCDKDKCCIVRNSKKFWTDIDCDGFAFYACEKRHSLEPNQDEKNEKATIKDLECSGKALINILNLKGLKALTEQLNNCSFSKSNSTSSTTLSPVTVSSDNSLSPSQQPQVTDPDTIKNRSSEFTVTSSPPVQPIVTVPEELIHYIIQRYQEDQLNVIKLWFQLIRTHRRSSEQLRQPNQSIDKPTSGGFQLSLVILTVLSTVALLITVIALSIIARRFLRLKTQDTYQVAPST